MRTISIAAIVWWCVASHVALAQEPTPAASPSPEATPQATPEATPLATPEATPQATPEATPQATPEPIATPDPTPPAKDWRGGMPGRPAGARDWRVGLLAGGHAFFGQGWNEDQVVPQIPENEMRRTEEFLAAAITAEAIYDLQPTVAAVAIAGAHSGQNEADEETPISISYTAWHAGGALRFQTPANEFGVYLQAGAGIYLGVKKLDHESNDDLDDEWGRAGTMVHAAAGATWHAAPGLDFVAEIRGSRAPGRFEDETIDLGGVTATVGATIRVP